MSPLLPFQAPADAGRLLYLVQRVGWAEIGVLNTPESRRASWFAKSCSRFFSITVLLSVAPVRGFLFRPVRGPVFLDLLLARFQLLRNRGFLCRTTLRHRFTAFGIVVGVPQLIIGHLLFCQRVEIPKLAPCPERLALHRLAGVVVKMSHRQVVLRAGIGSYIHGPLGRVILEKIRAGSFQPGNAILLFIAEYTAVIVPDGLTFPVKVMPPIVVPFPVFLGKLPGHKRIGALKFSPIAKPRPFVKQNRLLDHIALIFFQNNTSLDARHLWTKCPEAAGVDVEST